jgi:Tol biopolymer transport system component
MKSFWFFCSMILSAAALLAHPHSDHNAHVPRPAHPSHAALEATFLSNTRQLIYEGLRSGEGYFSADGKALIFQSERERDNPFYQIYILDLESGDAHRVSPGHGKTTCAFFRPGAGEVLFASTHHDPDSARKQREELDFRASGQQRRYAWDYDEQMEIYSAHRDGSNLRRLTHARGYDAEAAYSPDGNQIVFTSNRHAYSGELSDEDLKLLEIQPSLFADIYTMNADGTGVRRLTFNRGYDGGPFFSADGSRIVWRRFNEKGTIADVFTMAVDGSDVRQITDFGCMSWSPYFHPSGEYIIFTANKLGFQNFELFLVDARGTREPVRVTFTEGFDGLPVFSPDGRKLSWTSGRTSDGKSQIFIADWNHSAARNALHDAPRRGTIDEEAHHAVALVAAEPSAVSGEISAETMRAAVEYLASEPLAGRMTGTKGTEKAAGFIADKLAKNGLEPLGNSPSFFQSFEFSAGVTVVPDQCELVVAQPGPEARREFSVEVDFRPLSFTANGAAGGEVVFAGYGLSVPGQGGQGYDSYAGLDVSNKVVMVLRYVPEEVSPNRRQELNRYAGLRYKAMIAREKGARALLVVTGPNSPNSGALAPLSFDSSLSGSEIVAASINLEAAQAILAASGQDLKTVQSALDKEDPHAMGSFAVPNTRVTVRTTVERLRKTDRNVVALLPPSPGVKEYVMVGAHYDHLGLGENRSLEAKEGGQIHPGADDNASGVALVLELAASLAAEKKQFPDRLRRGIIFAFWSGEELGLIGSSHFAEHPPVSLDNVVAYVNFDMVGRLRENRLMLQGIGSSSAWRRLIEKRNVAAGFDLVLQDDPYLPTDVTAFYPRQVPVLNFFTGSHEDYHRPSDTADTLNYEGLERITRFARAIVRDLAMDAGRPDYVKVERTDRGGNRDGLRIYLGTVPDYSSGDAGLKIAGTGGGSPAEKAGLRKGDVIVELAGQKVANIYDFMFAMEGLKIGEPAGIVVLREGERVSLRIVPETRK